jgi:hypothetical protein
MQIDRDQSGRAKEEPRVKQHNQNQKELLRLHGYSSILGLARTCHRRIPRQTHLPSRPVVHHLPFTEYHESATRSRSRNSEPGFRSVLMLGPSSTPPTRYTVNFMSYNNNIFTGSCMVMFGMRRRRQHSWMSTLRQVSIVNIQHVDSNLVWCFMSFAWTY